MIKLNNIIDFLQRRGWQRDFNKKAKKLPYHYYKAPSGVLVSEEYRLSIFVDEQNKYFQSYAEDLISIIVDVYDSLYTANDLKEIFSNNSSIFSVRISDEDTNEGSISLRRIVSGLRSIEQIFIETMKFFISSKNIFSEVDNKTINDFANSCRALIPQKGSYITKIEVPNTFLSFGRENETISSLLLRIISFFNDIVEKMQNNSYIEKINKAHIREYQDVINVNIFESFSTFVHYAQIKDIDFSVLSVLEDKKVSVKNANDGIKVFRKYTEEVKKILLDEIPIDVKGRIVELKKHFEIGSIVIIPENNRINRIIVFLDELNYSLALEAHKNNKRVRVIGIVNQEKNNNEYHVKRLDSFSILQ